MKSGVDLPGRGSVYERTPKNVIIYVGQNRKFIRIIRMLVKNLSDRGAIMEYERTLKVRFLVTLRGA